MKLKAGGKFLIIALVVGGIGWFVQKNGYLENKTSVASSVPPKMELPSGTLMSGGGVSQVNLAPASSDYVAKMLTIPWNATLGIQYANGGEVTAPGSLMAKRGVKLQIERQDDYSKMLADLVVFAKDVSEGKSKPNGAAFVIIMGDGYPAFIAGAQESMSKLGQQLEVIGAVGYSRGEDKCMLPAEVKSDPQKARGSLIGAVLRDGDWNICVKWASDNGIAINPDEKTYDPNAMNFVAVNSFTEADEKLITGYCETRPVVVDGKRTAERRKVCQNGTATWTPGDVKVAREKGGVVSIASTKEYMWQMPATIIGNKQWMAQNRQYVENMLAAAFEGGEIVRRDDSALEKGAAVAAKVFKEESAAYWKKYFKGVTERDKTGQMIELGGSTTNGLGDNAFLFGLNGNDNIFKRVYNVFGNITVKYYPDVMPKVIPYESVVNTSYLEGLLKNGQVADAAKPVYVENAPASGAFARRSVSIEFETGRATFTPRAVQTLDSLLDQLSVSGLAVQVNGHTDNIGNQSVNIELSKKRAEAVKNWLTQNAPASFPAERIRTRGYGDTQPVADNNTNDGRSKNRRVEIILLSN